MFLRFSRKNVFWRFSRENAFWRENTFCSFHEKTRIAVLAGNAFDEKTHFRFWWENTFCGFGGKTCFCVLAENCIWGVLA